MAAINKIAGGIHSPQYFTPSSLPFFLRRARERGRRVKLESRLRNVRIPPLSHSGRSRHLRSVCGGERAAIPELCFVEMQFLCSGSISLL